MKQSLPNVYNTDGLFVCSFGEGILKDADDITAANDGRVMVVSWDDSCVHVFSDDGVHLNQFKLREYGLPTIAFHQLSEHVIIAGREAGICMGIYTKYGEFVCSTEIHEECSLKGMTVTRDGRITLLMTIYGRWKVLVI